MNEKNTLPETRSSRDALRRLILVLVIAAAVSIYSYGWTVTDIDLEKPQDPQRQENVGNALRELLSPRIFSQEREIIEIGADFRMVCDDNDTVAQQVETSGGTSVIISPTCGEPGTIVTVQVVNFEPLADARIRWAPPEGQTRPRDIIETGREEIVLSETGGFTGTIEVPRLGYDDGEIHQVIVRAAIPSGPVELSDITGKVILRMIETIFMALLATSIAIPIAGVISFLAARNLMTPVHLTVGNMMTAFIALFIGVAISGALFAPIGTLGVDLSVGENGNLLLGLIVPVVVVVVVFFGLRWLRTLRPPVTKRGKAVRQITVREHLVNGLNSLIIAVTIIFVLGALGGLFISIGEGISNAGESIRPEWIAELELSSEEFVPLAPGEWVQNAIADSIAAVGRLLNIIGQIIQLAMPLLASLIGGFAISSMAMRWFTVPLRHLPKTANYIAGALMGFVAGALLLAIMGALGMRAALLGLLPGLVAAILGGQILVLAYRRIFGTAGKRQVYERRRAEDTISMILFAIGAAAVFVFTTQHLNVWRSLVDGVLPPGTTTSLLGILEIPIYMLDAAIIGGVLGAVGGGLSGVQSNFPLGSAAYNISRTLLNTIRSIEPLIMGLVFVVWVGIGPFAGVLALTLHSIAALGKLYSEQIENIDEGPIEAIQSTGAGWLQTVIYAVVPQIIPPYIAFTMYRWDINVRMSTIIGFVGGGGIGLLLNQQINLLRYRDAGVAVLAIAIVVSILDYTSAAIRERLI